MNHLILGIQGLLLIDNLISRIQGLLILLIDNYFAYSGTIINELSNFGYTG